MAGLARIVQLAGWLWVIAGFVLPALGVADPSVFPGVILIFVARALRTQAARHAPPEAAGEGSVEPGRVLNTERPQPKPTPTPAKTVPRKPSKPSPQVQAPGRTAPRPTADPSVQAARDDLSERNVVSGRETGEHEPEVEKPPATTPMKADERQAPMSSAEMIARAKKRWDNKS